MFHRRKDAAIPIYEKNENLEVGNDGRIELRKQRARMKKIRALFIFLFFAWCCVMAFWKYQWDTDARDIFDRMAEFSAREHLSCVSSHHVNATNREWMILNNNTRAVNVRVTKLAGEQMTSREEFTHCPKTFTRSLTRRSIVHVLYEDESFISALIYKRLKSAVFTGESALCVQHMLDIFAGRVPCK